MQPSPSVDDFLEDPVGHYYVGRRHCMFMHSETFLGYSSWGLPDVADVTELLRLCEVGIRPVTKPHRFLVDVRGLEFIDPSTFGLFLTYTRTHRDVLRANILGQAQLRPDGLVGAIISGFSHVANLPYPERVFGDVDEALTWLHVDHATGTEVLAELDAIREASGAHDGVVAKLRDELRASGVVPVDRAARKLGLSTRALQRALQNAGTAYRTELKSFQIRRAKELLERGDHSLAAIAGEVGFSSAQHFATAFRRAIGHTPSAWRAERAKTG